MGQTDRLDTIRRAVRTVQLAEQDMVNRYDYQLQVVLGVLDSPEALVTDESTVGDFVDSGEDAVDVARLAELSDIFNTPVSLGTKLWELAKSLCFEEYGELTDVKSDTA